jgi:glycosyltransferase involved in cell wall biosynthesis
VGLCQASPVRVLTIGNMYPPHHLGGYELVWREAVNHLRSRGWTVRVLTTTFRHPDRLGGDEQQDRDADVHRELNWYWRDHQWPKLGIRERLDLEHRNAATLHRHLEGFRPDAVGWWAMGGMSLSMIERVRRRGLPAAGFVCEEWMIYGPRVDGWMRLTRRPVLRPIAERVTGVPTKVRFREVGPWLFPSEMLRRQAAAAHGLTDTAVAHQGIDRQAFAAASRPEWRWRLLYVGRIDPRKGIDLAIEALSMLPPTASLDVVGAGDAEHLGELRSLAGRLGVLDRVRFHSAEPQPHLRERYADADVVVFPVRWREPWGLVPLEAMAVGTPVIATGRGGSGEYLRDRENCLLFDPDQGAPALTEAVRALAGDPELRSRLREGGFRSCAQIPSDAFNLAVEATLRRSVRH